MLQQVDAEMVTTSCCIRTGIVYTTLEAPMEKTQGIVVAGRCTMVSFQGLKAGTVESILNMVIGIAICLSFKACSIYWCILLKYTIEQNIFFLSGMLLYLLEN